jgi:hypothetical protein
MAVTIVTGDLATDTINQSQRVPDMDERIAELDPNEAPLVTLTKKLRKRPALAPKVEWLEHEPYPRFDVLSASAASNATTLPITNGNYFRVGDLIRNTNTGGAWEVTATAAGNITVGSPLGAVTPGAHTSGDEIFIVGNTNAEGSGLREIKTPKLANAFNYCEIVRHPYGLTGTEAATKLFGGPDQTRLKAEAAIEHMRAWEQIALTGAKSENLTVSGKPKRTAGGLIEFVTTNVTNAGGTLTEATFQTFLRSGFRYGSGGAYQGRKLLLASPLVISALEGFARSTIKTETADGRASTFGIQMSTYVSGQGEVDIVREPWLNDSINYKGYAFLIDLDAIEYRPLRETTHLTDRQSPDTDKMENEWLTEGTFVFKQERRFAVLKGVTG